MFAMKSFKVLMFLTLAAALSCGANGSPTNITTDGYPTKPSPATLKGIMDSLQGIADVYFKQCKGDYATFTKEYVDRLAWARPYNYVICFVKHSYKFDGVKGKDWDQGYVYDRSGSVGDGSTRYDVIVGGSGTFTRQGSGGYENWAWNGYTVWNQDMHSKRVTFVKPPTGRLQEGGGD
ncbi:hypothetical protein JOM56_011669 [Amanita muscaria]